MIFEKNFKNPSFVLQGVSQLTVIYNIQNTQIWVITDHTKIFVDISLPQEYKFSFEGESGHF